MIKTLKFILILAFFYVSAQSMFAQVQDTSEKYFFYEEPVIRDSVCYEYSFFPGDSIYYRRVSYDSIVIEFDEAILKERFERVLVTCDSVSKRGSFYLSIQMTDFISYESQGEIKGIKRDNSPWLGRKAHLEIDSVGNRLSARIDDPSISSVAPGGAFQPLLFFAFRDKCKAVDESWSLNTLDSIPENANPYPLMRHSFLFNSEEDIDTLGYECSRFRYIRTGQGSFSLINEDTKLRTTAIINSSGKVTISKKYGIPIHLRQAIEEKLTIMQPGDLRKPAWHYSDETYTIDLFKPSELRPVDEVETD